MNGITRRKVIEICRADAIPVHERNYSLLEAYGAEEAFLTGTFGAQTPVFEIDGRAIGQRRAGPVFQRIRSLYRDLVERDCGPAG
jgi:branched-chain amino acid aminotransferase